MNTSNKFATLALLLSTLGGVACGGADDNNHPAALVDTKSTQPDGGTVTDPTTGDDAGKTGPTQTDDSGSNLADSGAPDSNSVDPTQDSGASPDTNVISDSGTTQPDGNATPDSGNTQPDSGATQPDSGTVLDSGADTGITFTDAGRPVLSNVTEPQSVWTQRSPSTGCPDSLVQYAHHAPHAKSIGACTETQVNTFYDAYMTVSSTQTSRITWDVQNPTCKTCMISDWESPAPSAPVVQTADGHFLPNSSACMELSAPTTPFVECGRNVWQFEQCVQEVCGGDSTESQGSFLACRQGLITNTGYCGQAYYGVNAAILFSAASTRTACMSNMNTTKADFTRMALVSCGP